jgi:hypothetical protein
VAQSRKTDITTPYRQADVAREHQPASLIRPRCSCNKSSRSALEGRSSRPSPCLGNEIPRLVASRSGVSYPLHRHAATLSFHGRRQMSGRNVTSQTSHRPPCLRRECTLAACRCCARPCTIRLGAETPHAKSVMPVAARKQQQCASTAASHRPRQPNRRVIQDVLADGSRTLLSNVMLVRFGALSRNGLEAKTPCHVLVLSRHRMGCHGRH